MLVHDFLQVRLPFSAVADGLLAAHPRLEDAAIVAYAEARALHDELTLGTPDVSRALGLPSRLTLSVGPPRHRADVLVFPVALATSAGEPWIEGDLTAAPVGRWRTRLGMSARSVRPAAGFGRRRDDELLALIAESAIRAFLGQIAAALELTPTPALHRPSMP